MKPPITVFLTTSFCLFLATAPLPSAQAQTAQKPSAGKERATEPNGFVVDARIRRILEEMVRSYRSSKRLDLDTKYSGLDGVPNGMSRIRLSAERPNKLMFEVEQQTAEREKPFLTRYQSDGKFFYTYQEKQGWYNKEKAPKTFKELDFLAINLEMAALTGADPLAPLLRQAREVRLGAPIIVDGAQSDVVILDISDVTRTGEARLFINSEDHFLRRFDYSTQPLSKTAPATNPQLFPGERQAVSNESVQFRYETHVLTKQERVPDIFAWYAPPGSFEYRRFPSAADFNSQINGKNADKNRKRKKQN